MGAGGTTIVGFHMTSLKFEPIWMGTNMASIQTSISNIPSDISYMKYSSDLNLGEGLCIFTSFHFADSVLWNSLDFYVDLF